MEQNMDQDWMIDASCRDADYDPELWFPLGDGPLGLRDENRAKSVCADCSVRLTCLTFALDNGDDDGIWGGLNPAERRKIKLRAPLGVL